MADLCNVDTLAKKIIISSLKKETEVTFSIKKDIDSCVEIDTDNFESVIGANSYYDPYAIPEDMFNCEAKGCINSGTRNVTTNDEGVAGAVFTSNSDAIEYAAGVITYYVKLAMPKTYTVSTTVSDIKDRQQANSNIYIKEVTDTETVDGYYPIVIDLSTLPDSENGTGWVASEDGIRIKIEVGTDVEDDEFTIGLSSISVFDSIEDLEAEEVVKVACLSDLTGDMTNDVVDSVCLGAAYDDTTTALDFTITARMLTSNYRSLNPLISKSEESNTYYLKTESKTVNEKTVEGIDFGYIKLNDYFAQECKYTFAQIGEACNRGDDILNKVNTPVVIELNQRQFIVQDDGTMLFNKELVGKKLIVSYPIATTATIYEAKDSNLNKKRVSMEYGIEFDDKTRIFYEFGTVFITSFPMSVTTDENALSFSISVQRESGNDKWYTEKVIRKR